MVRPFIHRRIAICSYKFRLAVQETSIWDYLDKKMIEFVLLYLSLFTFISCRSPSFLYSRASTLGSCKSIHYDDEAPCHSSTSSPFHWRKAKPTSLSHSVSLSIALYYYFLPILDHLCQEFEPEVKFEMTLFSILAIWSKW